MVEKGKKMKDLGCQNGWSADIVYPTYKDMVNRTNAVVRKPDTTPPEYTACREAGHPLVEGNRGRCWTQYTCPICQITWDTDSSD